MTPTRIDVASFITSYNNHPVPRMSSHMAEVISGTHDLNQFSNMRETAEFVYGLMTYYNAMQEIGWVEHTSDWDWAVYVTTNSGKVFGDDQGARPHIDDPTEYCDTFRLWDATKYCELTKDNWPHELDEDFEAMYVILEFFEHTINQEKVPVQLSDIASITIEER